MLINYKRLQKQIDKELEEIEKLKENIKIILDKKQIVWYNIGIVKGE